MTKDEIEEEAGILDLACRQIAEQLAQGGLRAAADAHRRLGVIVRKLEALEEAAKAAGGTAAKPDL